MVDHERLFNLVFEREPKWDSTSKKHHNRDITRKLNQKCRLKVSKNTFI